MNKVVVITGASSGIGRALALEFSKVGYQIVLAARNSKKLTEVEKECQKYTEVLTCKTDVSIKSDCKNLISKSIDRFNKIDILINNAGISMRAILNNCDLDVIEQVMQTNFMGTVYCTKYALPYLIKSKGTVVGVSSIAGYRGLPARTGYSASKFAMHGFLQSLRTENKKTGLKVLLACPGYTASNIRAEALNYKGNKQGTSPLEEKNIMQPKEVALKILKAVKNNKKELVLTTEGKVAVFLSKFFPNFVDKMIYKKVSSEKDSPF